MKTCRVCGFHNPDANQRCTNCQSLLNAAAGWQRSAPVGDIKQWLLTATLGFFETIWRRNPLRHVWKLPSKALPYRYPCQAAVLGLLPPLGQLYNRQVGKALLLGVGFWGSVALGIQTLHQPWSNALLLAVFLYWVFIATDALITAIRINGEHWSFRNSVATWCAMLFYAGIAITAVQFLLPTLFLLALGIAMTALVSTGRLRHVDYSWRTWSTVLTAALLILVVTASLQNSGRIFALVRLRDNIGSGNELRRGDLLLVSYAAYWFRTPRVGEVVYFDPPAFRAEEPRSGTMIIINAKDYFQRIAGQGGDIIETSPPQLLRNGAPLANQLEPFGMEFIAVARKFRVPEDHYFLPMTNIPRELLNVTPPRLFQPGWVFPQWEDACIVPSNAIMGKVVAIVNPPEKRRWF
ncbi:MAG: S26 family signal peptidase [Candidatus Sumerlaeaceae bacterium]|nr:S26 family signal peptidase [Candidatus Sumerlaeaceae bacterium]